jgi:hypothetical protein
MKREGKENEGPETAEREKAWEQMRASSLEEIRPVRDVPKAVLRQGVLLYSGVPVHQLDAMSPTLAARMVSLCFQTLKEDIDRGLLQVGPRGLISREALQKYLRGETGRTRK